MNGSAGESAFDVDKILMRRSVGKGKTKKEQYLVQWRGYKASRATWESPDSIDEGPISAFNALSVADAAAAKTVALEEALEEATRSARKELFAN